MSVQVGRWNFDGKPVEQDYLEKVQPLLQPYGPDDRGSYSSGAISMLYCAFHTTKESRRETQPHVMASGAIITWDGRLDNRAGLIRQLGDTVTSESTDVSIVAAAYERWGGGCFAQLIGDWALAIWEPRTRSLTLAKDPIGVRHLYYSFDDNQVTWSTILDPLVLFAEKAFTLCEEYIAGWFSFFPAAHLTPYVGIHSVPPSSSVVLRPGKRTVTKYWDFDPGKRIRYRTDGEYEEHFRVAFGEAVRRRLRSDGPTLAELSGGMDSSSIVCMADAIIARVGAETPRLDTISYYDDSEPNWNERPYFSKVEEKRGRAGCHIDVSKQDRFTDLIKNCNFAVVPGSGSGDQSESSRQRTLCMVSQGDRVVLSGTGGDEAMGGVPTPIPMFEDLLAGGHLGALAHELKVWALNKRKPWFHLLFETLREFMPPALVGVPKNLRPAPWLDPAFTKRHYAALTGYRQRVTLFGPKPSFQDNLSALCMLQRQLSFSPLSSSVPYEKRYPYLDRSLLEFIYAIPREQMVRPGQRRSLMRRALAGIVPEEILNRKRKAFVVRSVFAGISAQLSSLLELTEDMVSNSLGIVMQTKVQEALDKARLGQEVPLIPLMRTLGLESWLNGFFAYQISKSPILAVGDRSMKDRLIRHMAAANRGEAQASNPEKPPAHAKLAGLQ
jgi:asparagine synthase (glutamine-hydrolysing)